MQELKKNRFNYGKAGIILSLAFLFILASGQKVSKYKKLPFYDAKTDAGLFATESAFQYYYAKIIADGGSIPEYDKRAQWPEGIHVYKELSIFMEVVHGMSYRVFKKAFPGVPFHVYLVYFNCYFTSISILLVFWAVRLFGFDRVTALLCAFFYAFTNATYSRIYMYEYEYFALPFIFTSLILFIAAIRKNSLPVSIASGLSLFIALCSWHFTRFYLLAFVTGICIAYYFARQEERGNFRDPFIVLTGFAALAGVLSPVMRAGGLLFSPQMVLMYGLLAGMIIDKKFTLDAKGRIFLIAAIFVLVFILFVFRGGEKDYGHVWSLLKYKLLFLNNKPDDPLKIPYDARVLWQGDFNGLSMFSLLYGYGFMLVFSIIGSVKLFKEIKNKKSADAILLFSISIIFLLVTIMIRRLGVFLVFFMAVLMAWIAQCPLPVKKNRKNSQVKDMPSDPSVLNLHWAKLAVIVLCLFFTVKEAFSNERTALIKTLQRMFPEEKFTRTFLFKEDKFGMLNWIIKNTPASAAFTTNFELGPTLLVYAGRPVTLQPKFETFQIRDKFRRFMDALYGENEEAFYSLMKEFDSEYYLQPLNDVIDRVPDSYRYIAGKLDLPRKSMAYRFHFNPKGLELFKLVFRNKFYQVYKRVDKKGVKINYKCPYYPIYDEKLYYPGGIPDSEVFSEGNVDNVLRRIRFSYKAMGRAQEMMNLGYMEDALVMGVRSVTSGLPDAYLYFTLAKYYIMAKDSENSIKYASKAVELDSEDVEYKTLLLQLNLMKNMKKPQGTQNKP